MKVFNIALIIVCFIACSSEPNTIEYAQRKFTKETIASKIKFEETINLSLLNDSIKLQLPFEIDTSFIVSEWCGNAPRCKKYITKKENNEIEICQQHHEVINIPELKNKEQDQFLILKYEEKLKRKKHKLYGYNVKHNLISFDVFENLKSENWKISGIEILSEEENNTIKVNCVNKQTKSHINSRDSSLFQLDWYTIISLDLTKTEMKTIDVLESVQFICERIKT